MLTCEILDRQSQAYGRYIKAHKGSIKGVTGKYNKSILSISADTNE